MDGILPAAALPPAGTRADPLLATADAAALLAAAAFAERAVERNPSFPAAGCLLLHAGPGGLAVTGTDRDVWATARVAPGLSSGTGAACIPARPLLALLRKLPPRSIRLTAPPDARELLTIKAHDLEATIAGVPAEDFPTPEWLMERRSPDDSPPADLRAAELRRLIAAVRPAVSAEPTRYYLNGVFFHATDAGTLRLVATDGRRLHFADTAVAWGDTPDAIVPRRAVGILHDALEGRGVEPVQIRVWRPDKGGVARFAFAGDGWSLVGRAIDGTYPEYQKVVPKPDPARGRMRVARPAAFSELLDAAAAVSDVRAIPVVLRADGRGVLRVACRERDDRAEVAVPPEVAAWEGPPMGDGFGFQARYLRDLCAAFPGGFVLQAGASDGDPALIEAKDGTAALMPVRLTS